MSTFQVISRGGVFVWEAEGSIEASVAGTAQPGDGWILVTRHNITDWRGPQLGTDGGGGGGFQAAWAIGSNVLIGAMQ